LIEGNRFLLYTSRQITYRLEIWSEPLSLDSHFKKTTTLARALKRKDVYGWLVTKGYFPEPYVLPPCFLVTAHPRYGKIYWKPAGGRFFPRISECQDVHFPKTDYTDRTFGVIDPEIHSDIAYTIARNWKTLLKAIFHKENKVCSYSFPIPLDARNPGSIGTLRAGRMIYEYIEMAESDIASVAFRYKYLIKTDIKNFYPSIYTHSIPWAIHGKKFVRKGRNRNNYSFFGNRLDKLFQNANDGCTNGVPIGPAVSDVIAETILSGVDRLVSRRMGKNVVAVRFKDDYRILATTEQDGRSFVKALQSSLKEYRLELNDEKTEFFSLPDGVYRPWVTEYHYANPRPKSYYEFKRFKEVCLSVMAIDRRNPGCGVIDRFFADIVTKKHRLRVRLNPRSLPHVLSLLLTLGNLRTKAFPMVLAIIESILRSPFGASHINPIVKHLNQFLRQLAEREQENKYLIGWICYFVRANGLEKRFRKKYRFSDPIVRAIYTSRFTLFDSCPDFRVFTGVKGVSRKISMLSHLDVFKPQ
jgi:hypothetical protein